ncbi:MAG: YfhO family protein [Bacteroidales bacterium]|jgi:hypothetical protein|nr:YfhO family protein [Bacteroidales bacterium]
MKKFKTYLPHIVAVVLFAIISLIYSSPLLEGKKIKATDLDQWTSISEENRNYTRETGESTLWTNSMFSGMPYYTISAPQEKNVFWNIYRFITFGKTTPFGIVFWYLLGFYILLLVMKINPWLSIAGAIAYAFSSYFFVILLAGHITKAFAIAFMAPVIAGIYLAYEREKPWQGLFLTTFFLSLEFITTHVQIIYYAGMITIIYVVFEFIYSIINKHFLRFLKTSFILLIAPILALSINFATIYMTAEYTQYSLRGKSELNTAQHDRSEGLDKSYATAWSYGIGETFTLLIPNMKGASSNFNIGEDSETYKVVQPYFGYDNAKNITKYFPAYFGDQPFTMGTVYVGAIICFLFVLGLFIVKGKIKWILLTCTIVSFLLAWGHNFAFLTNFCIDYLPGYNKFRTVSTILVIAEFSMPLLGILAINEILKKTIPLQKLKIFFFVSFAIIALPLLIFIVSPSVSGVNNQTSLAADNKFCNDLATHFPTDASYNQAKAKFVSDLLVATNNDKINLVRDSAIRSFIFLLLGGIVVMFLIYRKKSVNTLVPGLAFSVLFLCDLVPIDRDYFNKDNFEKEKKNASLISKSNADEFILKDNSYYRVLNLTTNPLSDGITSYWHHSIGGYSGAKIRRYQDICDTMFTKPTGEFNQIQNAIYTASINKLPPEQLQTLFSQRINTPALNMLNAKYIIYNPQQTPLINKNALGNAWFIKDYEIVNSADDEINALKTLNTAEKAIVSKQFEKQATAINLDSPDSLATITLTDITPNTVEYETSSSTDQFAVFSEIYYPKGWKVFIDNSPSEHFRADYVLRAMKVPSGNHHIKFSFEPDSYKIGIIVSYIAVFVYFLIIFVFFGLMFYKNKTKINSQKII